MNKLKQLFAIALIASAPLAVADGVTMEMYGMNRQMNGLFNAKTAEGFQQSAQAFLAVAQKAKETMPNSLEGDQEEFKGYQEGMQQAMDVVADAEKLAAEGKLEEAKTSVRRLLDLKKTYHQKYK